MDKIIAACKQTGAEAVHPGYGFLSENEAFARRVEEEGIVFIGPKHAAIAAMGDKIASKKLAGEAERQHDPRLQRRDRDAPSRRSRSPAKIGYPVMIKASAGGGGKGLRVACNDTEADEGFASCRNEAQGELRRRPRLHREVRRGAAPHRDPGARRRARQLRLPVGARVLDPAPPPEGDRGGAEPVPRRRDAQGDGRAGGGAGQGGELPVGGHRRVRRRQGQELLLPRDEHAAAGRAPGHRVDHRPRPGRADDPRRRRREARLRAGAISRATAGRSSAASTPRIRCAASCRRTGRLVVFRRRRRRSSPARRRRRTPACASTPASTRAARSRSTTTR